MVVVTRKVITYGIRAGSTHDLGFATAFVDINGFYYTVAGIDVVTVLVRFCELILGVFASLISCVLQTDWGLLTCDLNV